ncbi:ABC transporter permease [Nocardioides sp. zg-1308]|uniref:ABC transporter permease n=1 Tax=Nocardioides sp. zg-1308 TaxID=2736253 RepID=UPI0015567BC0|nr:ABC transporter permease [Nocardioides sp. zg-1308]NPD04368.1 ABC transporter permease [Nocardioides sp. zg-1308]
MSRVLRGAWSRRGALTTLVLMTLVVVGGSVTVLQLADAAGTSRWLTAPLLLLGAVAVPSIGAELAVARREEIGLARLRGIHGARLWRFLLVEPLLAIVLGTLLGLAVGAAGTVVATRTWLAETAPALERPALLAAVGIAGAGLAIVGLSAAAALREPLAVQVSTRRRPRRATTLAVFLSVLVIVGAAVAAYRSRAADGDPDLVVLLGPALVGLALGQVAIWVVRIAARVLTPATERRGLGAFLAARRLARADDLVTPVRLVVAAAVVGTLALSGAVAVSGWTRDQAAVEVPGQRTIDATELGAMGAVDLTEQADPEGTHLLATAIVRNETRLGERRAYVDAGRWDAVVGDFYDGSPARAASDAVGRLGGGAAPFQVAGDRLTVTASGVEVPPAKAFIGPGGQEVRSGGGRAEVVLNFVTEQNTSGSASVQLRVAADGTAVSRRVRVPDCAEVCTVTSLQVGRDDQSFFDRRDFVVLLEGVAVGDTDVLDRAWVPDLASVAGSLDNRFIPGYEAPDPLVVNRTDGLQVAMLPDAAIELRLDMAGDAVPLLTAGDAGEGGPQALDLAGDDRATEVVGVARSLPLLGTAGSLADIRTAAAGSGPTVPSAEVQVVAGDSTPQAVLDQVAEATGATWRTRESVQQSLGDRFGGDQSVAYALTALACALVALLALGAGVARHLRDYRRDVASLRVLGISTGTARRAGRAELASLTVLVLVAVVAGGWLAVTLLLDGLPLLAVPVAGLALDTAPHLWPLAVPAVVAAAAMVLVGGRARAVRATTTRPSLLREEEGR